MLVSATASACGSETNGSSSGQGGAAGAAGHGGGSTVSGIGASFHNCVGCGEFVTTSAAEPELCDASSLDLYVTLFECLCGECEAICGMGCRLPGDECSACKLTASYGACKAQADACASDF